jgi:hypothetical protein
MKTINVSKATGPALDWLVAKCLGKNYLLEVAYDGIGNECPATRYSTNWEQGSPLIEREFISVGPYHGHDGVPTGVFQAYLGWDRKAYDPLFQCDGPTPLIAAMRCFCISKLGHEVEIPDEFYKK